MSKYDSLFEKGYYIGDLSEFSVNMDELIEKCNQIYLFANDKEKYFDYFNIIDDKMPHRIPYNQREERLNYIKENLQGSIPYNSANNLNRGVETNNYFNYFRELVKNFIQNVYPELTPDKINVNDVIQMYQEGDYQHAHSDGHVGDCVVIIYLSDPSKYNNTGKLEFLEGPYPENVIDSVDPVLGKFTIFELTKHNIRHRVQMVTDDFLRFSFLGQVRRLH